MAVKVPITYKDYKNFPLASNVSMRNSTYVRIVPIIAAVAVVIINPGSFPVGILIFVILTALGILLVKGFHDPSVLKAMFASLIDLTPEQQKAFARAFMNGKPIGKGDMQQACMAAGKLQKAALDLHNRKITKEQYEVKVQGLMAAYRVNKIE